jgi:hypothetical protein
MRNAFPGYGPHLTGARLVALLNGHREQGILVIEIATGRSTQTLKVRCAPKAGGTRYPAGLALSPDNRFLEG